MKKTKLFIMMVVAAIFFVASGKTTMAQEERSYFIVTSGTATKLGTNEVEQISNKAYLEEWQLSEEVSLSQKTKDTLLKASNSKELPVKMQDVTYLTLNDLASKAASKSVSGSPVYQGYAQLGLKDAKEGYTFGVYIEITKTGEEKITGYYAEISGKSIYKIDLLCEKSTQSMISLIHQQAVEKQNEDSISSEEQNNTIEIYSAEQHKSSKKNKEGSSTQPPTPPIPPTPPTPTPPPNPPIDPNPPVPGPVIPGVSTETSSIVPPTTPPITGTTIPGQVVEGATE